MPLDMRESHSVGVLSRADLINGTCGLSVFKVRTVTAATNNRAYPATNGRDNSVF